ncbi:MAG: TonB-dependent receptor, partial [Deltaproteobacteria bacterium]|nr:TonB-dependent receptor [Deltaproteobacteria bacterium]
MIVPLFLALLGAPGDPAPDPDPGVEITAARRPLDLLDDRAAAGTVLLPADLDDPGETLPAVLDQQAGLRVVRLGGPAAFSTLSIRGSSGDQVLVVLDGIPMDSAAGGAADLSRLPLGNLERIEVYRGASPLRFGASAIGGVLSLATRRARGRDLAATLSTGAFGERGLRLFAGERRAGWDAALGLDYAGWEGDFPYRNDQGTRFDPSDDRAVRRRNDHADQVNLLARGGVRLAPGWRAEALDWFFWRDQGLPGLGQFETRAAGFRAAESHTAVRLLGEDLGGRADWTTDLSLRWTRSRVEDPDDEIGLSRGGALLEAWAPALRSHAAAGLFPWWDVQAAAGYRWERVVAPGGAAVRHRADGGVETGFHVAGAALSLVPSVRVEWLGSRDRGPPA